MANQIKYQVGFDIQQNNLNQLKASLQQLNKLKIGDIMKINGSDAAAASTTLNNIRKEAARVEDALKAAFNAKLNTVNIETFNKQLSKTSGSINEVYKTFKQAGTAGENAFRSLSSYALSTNIQLKETHNILDKMATTLTNTLKWNVASSAINTMSRSVEQAFGYVKALDTSLNDIRIVTNKTADDMGRFAEKANDVAQSLGKTTVDYTNAALIYAQQGLSDKQIEQRAAITLKTANVTGQSTDAVSEELTAVWNGYKVNAEQAELYVDRLAAVAATTASDLEELSTGMSKVASAANLMGVNEDQLAAQLSTIISVTREAPETIGTSLKTIYARISDIKSGIAEDGATLGYYSGKMAQFGINVLDANGNLRDMGDVMEDIGDRWGTLTREQQVYLTQTMAGQRQYSRLLALFDNWGEYEKALNTAQNAAGTLQEQQDIYMESTAAHLQTLKASVENIYDSFADTDSINTLIDAAADLANVVASMIDGLGGGVDILKTLGAVGMMVFSTQIAKGLNTTITNFEIASNNARQFDQALEATRQWQGIPGLDEMSKKLLQNREQILELIRLMSPEQFEQMQNLLNEMTVSANEYATALGKQQALNSAVQGVTSVKDAWQGLQQVMKDPEAQKKVVKDIRDQENLFKNLSNELKTYGESLKQIGKKATQGQNIVPDLKKSKVQLEKYEEALSSFAAKGYIERHSAQIEELGKELNLLDDDLPADEMRAKLEQIAHQFRGMAESARESAEQMGNDLEANFDRAAGSASEARAEAERNFKQKSGAFETEEDRIKRAQSIESYTKLAGSIASVGMSIQQVKNLGSIIADKDLSTGEKALQITTNLAMTFSMLVPAIQGVVTAATGLRSIMFGQAAAETVATATTVAHAGALELLELESGKAMIAVNLFNKTLLLNPYVLVTAAILALVAALALHEGAARKAAEQQREYNESLIESENKTQEEIKSRQELYSSLEQLNEQYKSGQITREELSKGIEDLAKQYGLEEDAIDRLTGSYENLNQAIKDQQEEDRKELLASTKREQGVALRNFRDVSQLFGGQIGKKDGKLYKSINTDPVVGSKLKEKLGSDYTSLGEYAQFTVNAKDANAVIKQYEDLTDAISELEKEAAEKGDKALGKLFKSQAYQQLNDYLKELQDSYDALSASVEENNKALTAFLSKDFDSKNIQNIDQYIAERQKYIDAVMKSSNMDLEEASNQVDEFLRQNQKELYSRFDAASDFIEKLSTNLREGVPKEIKQMLGELTPDSIAFLDQLKLDNIGDWRELKSVIEYLQNADLSSLTIVTDLQTRLEEAENQYNQYSSLAAQIKDSKKQTISKKEFESLDEETQKFFDRMANGTYKMTGDAEEFYETVNNKSLEGFKQNIEDLQGSSERLKKFQGLNYNDLLGAGTSGGDWNYVNDQLDYLTEAGYNLEKIIAWKAELGSDTETWSMTTSALNDIAEAMESVGDQTGNFTKFLSANEIAIYQNQLAIARSATSLEDLKKMYEDGEIAIRAFSLAAIELDESLDLEGLDTEELDKYAEHLQDIADKSGQLADTLKGDAEAAQIVAKGIMKMNDAIDELADNWEEWSDIFRNSSIESEEYANAMSAARETIADLLDISKEYVSDDFIKDHLDEITQVAQGSETAIDNLKAALADDVILRIIVENGLQNEKDSILSSFQELQNSIPDLEVGATLKDDAFVAKMQDLLIQTGATVDQANAIFDALGFQATFKTEPQEVTQRSPITVTKTEAIGETSGTYFTDDPVMQGPVPHTWSYPILKTHSYNDGWAEEKGVIEVPAMATNGKTPIIENLTKKASASFSNYSSKNSGGKSPGSSSSSKSSSPKKSSSTSKPKKAETQKEVKPDTSQKDFKKTLEDDRDIYHDINVEIEQIERNLQRVQKVQDRLFGKNLLKNLDKQTQILERHKEKLKEKQALQRQDLASQQAMLKTLGVTFDQYGNIVNYMDVLAQKQNVVNGLVAQYNSLISAYNASTDKDYKDNLNQQIDAVSKQIQDAEEDLKNTKDKIGNYDSLREAIEDITDQIEEETQKQIELNIKKFRMEVEIRLDMGEAQRDWNEFQRNVINHSDILKDTDFSKIFKDAKKDAQDIISYFDVAGSKGTIQKLTEQLNDTRTQLESIERTGSSAIYGDNMKQAQEDLQNDLSQLMNQLEEIENKIDSINESYLETIDDVSTNFDKQIEDYGFITDLIEHDIDLLNLLYGDKNYDAMEKYYTTLQRNQNNEMDALRKQSDFWKRRWDEALEQGDIQAAKKFEENYKKVLNNLNETILNSVKTLQDKYSNALNKIFDDLDKKLTNGLGTDYLNMEWDLMKQNADEYLDTINAAFAVQGLENKFKKAIDDSNAKNVKAQQALRNLMDDQLGKLRAKEKLTQYDVDRAEKLLQIEQARIALEQAQSSKTSMRLKRDSQGNYSYEYAADENNVSDAQDALSAAQNDLYNFDKAAYEANLKDMLSIYENFREKEKEIRQKHYENEADQQRDLALLQEQYAELMNAKTEENLNIRSNLNNSAFQNLAAMYQTNVSNYQNMAEDEKNILMQNLVPAWTSGIQIMADKIAGQGGFIPACEDAFEQVDEKTREYQNDLDDLARSAGNNLSDVKNGVDEVAYSFEHLIQDNDELTRRMDEEINIIRELRAEVQGTTEDFKSQRDAALAAVDAANLLLQSQRQQAAAEASNYNYGGAGSSSSGTSSGNSSFEWVTDSSDEKDGVISVGDVATFSGRYFYDSWGTSPAGSKLAGIVDAVQVDMLNNNEYGVHIRGAGPYANNVLYEDLGWIKRSQLYGYDTGGYTGAWGSTGRLALLHEKELVLNKEDTRNLLDAVSILRTVMGNFNGNIMTRLDSIKSGFTNILSSNSEELKQDVHIEANFPNVDSKKQIEDAFANLVNIAAQRVMR